MSEKRFTWKTEKLQHLDEEVMMVVDNVNKEWKGHILNIVDKLNEQDKEIDLLRLELETQKHPLWSTREAERRVNKLSDSLADEVKKNGLLGEEINQLRIENMRLGEELNDCEKFRYQVFKRMEELNDE